MFLGFLPPAWLAGVAALSASKILDNMEIGHNVMHGQYDWMRDDMLHSSSFEWDNVCPSDQWRHSHNYMHHTYTNILDLDRDIGYGILRMEYEQPWNPIRLGNPLYAFALMMLFEWGVMLHDLEYENVLKGKRKWTDVKGLVAGWWRKVRGQVAKDYIVHPALTGPLFPLTFAGNLTANLVRNVWAFSVIFCGHFPSGAQVFTQEETAEETRGEWYVRQMLGSANISAARLCTRLLATCRTRSSTICSLTCPHRHPETPRCADCTEHGSNVQYRATGSRSQRGRKCSDWPCCCCSPRLTRRRDHRAPHDCDERLMALHPRWPLGAQPPWRRAWGCTWGGRLSRGTAVVAWGSPPSTAPVPSLRRREGTHPMGD